MIYVWNVTQTGGNKSLKEPSMYHKGYCIFSVDPGECKTIKCRVCGIKCDVKRNVPGPHSYTEYLAKVYSGGKAKVSIMDVFACPRAQEKWHEKACELAEEMFETRSSRVKAMLKAEINDLVAKHRKIKTKVCAPA